jgi:dolichyl-phosphate-mannose-protein mannosyltransferase
MTPSARLEGRAPLAALAGVSAALLAVRLVAAARVGFGDSEALYAAYALHPQPAYLDHPGLIGVFARTVGGGTAPNPERAHLVTSLLAGLVPWEMALACRAAGASWGRSFGAAVVFALVPEIAIGLFAMTPDLLLALCWTGSLALAAAALRAPPASARATFGFAGAGLLAGAAAASKVTGLLLLAALVATYAGRAARAHARTIGPWVGVASGLVVLVPVVAFERRSGWPMLSHRLADTQDGSGFSLRNLGALVGGQLAYLSPLVAILAGLAARAAWRQRADAVGSLLLSVSFLPAAALAVLCLWSRVAEPHWMAPAMLALVPAMARAERAPSRRFAMASAALAGTFVAAVYAWVLMPQSLRLAPASYDPRLDLANELYGWPSVFSAVRNEVAAQWTPGLEDVAVVGPSWVVCAQLDAEMRGDVHVGCDSPIGDDFDRWWPRDRWHKANSIVWVTDERFGGLPDFPVHALFALRKIRVQRAGRTVRVFTVAVFVRRAST